jgi:hypothetical protein
LTCAQSGFSRATQNLLRLGRRLGLRRREVATADVLRKRYFPPKTHVYPTNYVVHAVTAPKAKRR